VFKSQDCFPVFVNRSPAMDHKPWERRLGEELWPRRRHSAHAELACAHQGEDLMRNVVAAILALSGIGVVGLAGSSPAMAYDYPWCVQGRGVGVPGDCSYETIEQCRASASGRAVYCNINPRVAFRRSPRGYYAPYPGAYYYR
jgi:hypothetical protein